MSALTPIDRETIRVIAEDRWTAALVNRDLDGLLALCADDVVYMPADHAALHGHDELRQWLSAFPPVAGMTQPIEWLDGTSEHATARVSAAVSHPTASSRTSRWAAWSSTRTHAAATPSSRTTASAAASTPDRTGNGRL